MYRDAIVQTGRGHHAIDRYVYNMEGEGLGNFFGSLLKQAVPLLTSAIKGAAAIAKPIAVSAGKELIATGAKRGAEELTKQFVHRPHKKRRRTPKETTRKTTRKAVKTSVKSSKKKSWRGL